MNNSLWLAGTDVRVHTQVKSGSEHQKLLSITVYSKTLLSKDVETGMGSILPPDVPNCPPDMNLAPPSPHSPIEHALSIYCFCAWRTTAMPLRLGRHTRHFSSQSSPTAEVYIVDGINLCEKNTPLLPLSPSSGKSHVSIFNDFY